MKLKPAIFLDRDGVLNTSIIKDSKSYAPRRLEDFHIFPEAAQITRAFKEAGFLVIVVTNQPDVGNGFVEQAIVDSMHVILAKTLLLDGIKVCYHPQIAGCQCRKPKPGMLLEASTEFGIDLRKSYMIGDRIGDVLAGQAAGCRTIFIDYGYAETTKEQVKLADFVVGSLQEASSVIL